MVLKKDNDHKSSGEPDKIKTGWWYVILVMMHLTQIQFCEREKKDQICENKTRDDDDCDFPNCEPIGFVKDDDDDL